jgi:hypothetical protein
MPRPLYSRRKRGYGGDFVALERLRKAVLADKRVSVRRYTSICDAIVKIKRALAPFKKNLKR